MSDLDLRHKVLLKVARQKALHIIGVIHDLDGILQELEDDLAPDPTEETKARLEEIRNKQNVQRSLSDDEDNQTN